MTRSIVSTVKALTKDYPNIMKETGVGSKGWAVKKYLESGGIIKLGKEAGNITLIYPDFTRLNTQIKDAEAKKSIFAREYKSWSAKYDKVKNEQKMLNIKKLSKKEYWKHLLKYKTDSDYRQMFDRTGLRTELVAHVKWDKMFNKFVNDEDYRQRLVETVENSVVYSKDRTLAKNADNVRDFVSSISFKKKNTYKEKVDNIERYIRTLKILTSWSK